MRTFTSWEPLEERRDEQNMRVRNVSAEKIINALRLQGVHQRRVSELTKLIKADPHCPREDGEGPSHLRSAFQSVEGDGYYGDVRRLYPDEIRALLKECPACAQRFEWILQRKEARRELGISKRVVSNYARQLAADRSEQ